MSELTLQEKIASNVWDHVRDVLAILKAASKGEWTWLANNRCKYIELRIDMRDGGCIIKDRDGNRIDPSDLAKQLGGPGQGMPWPCIPSPAPAGDRDAERDAADARRYRWLRDHKCNSLHISRNGDHACNYVTAKEWIEENFPEDFADDDPEEVEAMKRTNTIWRLQIYPDTPIGFNLWNASTLDAAIDAAMQGMAQGGEK